MLMSDASVPSVFPVIRFGYPIMSLRMVDGRVEMRWPEYLNTRSQDLEPAFHDAGSSTGFAQMLWSRRETLFAKEARASRCLSRRCRTWTGRLGAR